MKKLILIFIVLSTFSCNGQEQKTYSSIIKEIIDKRDSLMLEYSESDSTGQDSIIIVARNFLINAMTEKVFPYWYGTKWDFNGTTRTPQQGRIACGYFVTNILTDVGFNIPRIKWAQSASEVFIKKLAYNIKRFSNKPISEVEDYLLKSGDGVYLVGLDCHVGFIIVKNNKIRFIHSNYYKPEIGVMSENIHSRNPLNDSNYRIIGKLMSDKMIINWLYNNKYD